MIKIYVYIYRREIFFKNTTNLLSFLYVFIYDDMKWIKYDNSKQKYLNTKLLSQASPSVFYQKQKEKQKIYQQLSKSKIKNIMVI